MGKCILTKIISKSKHETHERLRVKEKWNLVWCSGKCNLTWLFEMERRRGESFLCLPSPTLFPFPSPSRPTFWFWPRSSRTISLSLRLPRRRPPEPMFSVGSRLCLSTGHSWFPFTQAQSTLYLLQEEQEAKYEVTKLKDLALIATSTNICLLSSVILCKIVIHGLVHAVVEHCSIGADFGVKTVLLTSCHSQNQNRWWSLCPWW